MSIIERLGIAIDTKDENTMKELERQEGVGVKNDFIVYFTFWLCGRVY